MCTEVVVKQQQLYSSSSILSRRYFGFCFFFELKNKTWREHKLYCVNIQLTASACGSQPYDIEATPSGVSRITNWQRRVDLIRKKVVAPAFVSISDTRYVRRTRARLQVMQSACCCHTMVISLNFYSNIWSLLTLLGRSLLLPIWTQPLAVHLVAHGDTHLRMGCASLNRSYPRISYVCWVFHPSVKG